MLFQLLVVPFLSALSVSAQSTARLGLTTIPNNITIGSTVTLTWTGGDNSPVTITLSRGPIGNLRTISTIAQNAPNNESYSWIPEKSLHNADDYVLELSQDNGEPDYSGAFTLTDTAASATYSATSTSQVTTTPASSISHASHKVSTQSSIGHGAVAGIAVGAVLFSCSLAGLALLARRHQQRRRIKSLRDLHDTPELPESEKKNGDGIWISELDREGAVEGPHELAGSGASTFDLGETQRASSVRTAGGSQHEVSPL